MALIDRLEQGSGQPLGLGPGLVGVAGGDGGAGRLDQQGMGQPDVGDRPGQAVDGRRPHPGSV